MAGALEWTATLNDKMSGPGRAMGLSMSQLTAELRSAGAASDAFSKKQEAAFKASIGRTEIAGLKKRDSGQESAAKADFAANMKHYDTVGLEKAKSAADAAAKSMDKLRAASKAASAAPYRAPQAVMGKTGANTPGVLFGQGQASGFSRLISQIRFFSPAAATATMGMAQMAAKADVATAKLGGLSGMASKAATGARAVGGAMLSVAAMAAKMALAVGTAIAGAGAAVAAYIVKIQAFKQATMFAFGALLGGQAQAAAGWAKVQAAAVMTGTSLMDTGAAFNSLLGQGFNLDEVDTLFKRMADLKTLNPATNIEGIARAVSQIKATGKLQGDELMQLNEAGLSSKLVYEELAKSLGKSVPEIRKMQEAGKITDKMAIDAIQAAIAKQTGGKAPGALAAEAASKTLMGGAGRLLARIQNFAAGLKIDFTPVAAFFERVGKVLEGANGKKLGASIEGVFAKVLGVLDTITEKDIAKAFDSATEAVDAMAKGAADFSDGMATADRWMEAIDGKMSAWGALLTGLKWIILGPWLALSAIMDATGAAINWVGEQIKANFMAISGLIDGLIAKVQKLMSGSSMLSSALGLGGNSLALGLGEDPKTGAASGPPPDQVMGEALRKATGATGPATQPGAAPPVVAPTPPPANVSKSYTYNIQGYTDSDLTAKIQAVIDSNDAADAN